MNPVATMVTRDASHRHRGSVYSHRAQGRFGRLQERRRSCRNDGMSTVSAGDHGTARSHLNHRRGHVAMGASATQRARSSGRQIQECAAKGTAIGDRNLDRAPAALDRQYRAERQRPVGGCHGAAVEDAPGSRASPAQSVASAVVSGSPGETMCLGNGRKRQKEDAGNDNAFHADTRGWSGAAPSRCPGPVEDSLMNLANARQKVDDSYAPKRSHFDWQTC